MSRGTGDPTGTLERSPEGKGGDRLELCAVGREAGAKSPFGRRVWFLGSKWR